MKKCNVDTEVCEPQDRCDVCFEAIEIAENLINDCEIENENELSGFCPDAGAGADIDPELIMEYGCLYLKAGECECGGRFTIFKVEENHYYCNRCGRPIL